MTQGWHRTDVQVAFKDEAAWVERHGAEFVARIRAMPWRNIRIELHYDIQADVQAASALDAGKEMLEAIECAFPDGGEGVYWAGRNRPWR